MMYPRLGLPNKVTVSDITAKMNISPSGRQIAASISVAFDGSKWKKSLKIKVDTRQIMNIAPSLKKFSAIRKTVLFS